MTLIWQHESVLIFQGPWKVEMLRGKGGNKPLTWWAQFRTVWMWGWKPQRQLCVSAWAPSMALLAGTHRSVLCLWIIHGTQRSVTPPQCHMNSSRCFECASREGNRIFTHRKCKNRAIVLYLCYHSITTGICCHREQDTHLIFTAAAKFGSADPVSPLALWHEKSTLRGWINIDPELTMEVSILRINPNS